MNGNRRVNLAEQDIPGPADCLLALPDQLREPELTAFRLFHARIREAQERLVWANQAWEAFVPVLRARYGLAETDQIDVEGQIHRAPKSEE